MGILAKKSLVAVSYLIQPKDCEQRPRQPSTSLTEEM